jgi:hypothetical protein
MITKTKLRKIMKAQGWIMKREPCRKGTFVRYYQKRLPYSSAISEFRLLDIIKAIEV